MGRVPQSPLSAWPPQFCHQQGLLGKEICRAQLLLVADEWKGLSASLCGLTSYTASPPSYSSTHMNETNTQSRYSRLLIHNPMSYQDLFNEDTKTVTKWFLKRTSRLLFSIETVLLAPRTSASLHQHRKPATRGYSAKHTQCALLTYHWPRTGKSQLHIIFLEVHSGEATVPVTFCAASTHMPHIALGSLQMYSATSGQPYEVDIYHLRCWCGNSASERMDVQPEWCDVNWAGPVRPLLFPSCPARLTYKQTLVEVAAQLHGHKSQGWCAQKVI